MVYMAGGDHLPPKLSPLRHNIGPRPTEPPTPTANFLTLGRMITQSALASTFVGTSLLASMACNTLVAFRMDFSSSVLVADHKGRVTKTRNINPSRYSRVLLTHSIAICPPLTMDLLFVTGHK